MILSKQPGGWTGPQTPLEQHEAACVFRKKDEAFSFRQIKKNSFAMYIGNLF